MKCKAIRYLWLCIALSAALLPRGSQAGISISPAYVDVSLEDRRPAGAFRVSNVGDEEERFRINALFFTLDRSGGLVKPSKDDRSMANWIKFNPKEFTVPPRQAYVVRFAIIPTDENGRPMDVARLKPGEYWAGMELESLKTGTATSQDAGGRTMTIKVMTAILVPIFGRIGEVRHEAAIKDVRARHDGKTPRLEAVAANVSNGRVTLAGAFALADAGGNVIHEGPMGRSYIFPEGERVFAADPPKDLPEGRYTLRVRFTLSESDVVLEKEAAIVWPPPAPTPVEASGGN